MNKPVLAVVLSTLFLTGCAGTMPKLGVTSGQLEPCPSTPNCVTSQTTDKDYLVEPIYYSGTAQEAQTRLLAIIEALPRTKTITVEENYIRAEFGSKIFRFVDDVEFYFPSTKTEKLVIDIRSASRLGHSDLGANRKRVEQIRSEFEKS